MGLVLALAMDSSIIRTCLRSLRTVISTSRTPTTIASRGSRARVHTWGQWGGFGTGNGQFIGQLGVAVDPSGNVYVADSGNNRIQKFSGTGTYLAQWGNAGSGNGQFDGPEAIAVSPAGDVYVSDWSNNRVQKFSSAGTYLTQWGTSGSGNGQLQRPGWRGCGCSGQCLRR